MLATVLKLAMVSDSKISPSFNSFSYTASMPYCFYLTLLAILELQSIRGAMQIMARAIGQEKTRARMRPRKIPLSPSQ